MKRIVAVLMVAAYLFPFTSFAASSDLDLIFAELEQKRDLPSGILRKICHAESRCQATARSNSSTAAGIFQWLDNSWQYTTRLMHQNRTICPAGCPFRLEHRYNPAIAAEVTAFSLNQMKTHLGALIQQAGVDMTSGLYMAHFLGEGGARKFFTALIQNPNQAATQLFPRAAAANGSIFRGRSLAEVLALMAKKLGQAPLTTGVVNPLRDVTGKLLVDNPSLYATDIFDRTVTVPASETELDYQTDYNAWLPQPPSQTPRGPLLSPSSLPVAQPSYSPPPQFPLQYIGQSLDLNSLFSTATNSPTYVAIEKSVNYFQDIASTGTRTSLHPLTLQNTLKQQKSLEPSSQNNLRTESNTDVVPLPASTFDLRTHDTQAHEVVTLNTIQSILLSLQSILQKVKALMR